MADLVRDLTSILKNGGQRAAYRRVAVDGDGVITPDETNWHNFVYRTASKITRDTSEEDIYGEDGEYLVTEQGNETIKYMLTSAQFDKATLDFLLDESGPTALFEFIVYWGLGAAGEKLEAYFPLVKFSGNFDVALPGRKFDITLNVLTNEAATTPTNFTGATWVSGLVAAFATPARRRMAIAETA